MVEDGRDIGGKYFAEGGWSLDCVEEVVEVDIVKTFPHHNKYFNHKSHQRHGPDADKWDLYRWEQWPARTWWAKGLFLNCMNLFHGRDSCVFPGFYQY